MLNRKQIIDPYTETEYSKFLLELFRQHTEPYSVDVSGVSIIVHPNVFSPKYGWSTQFHIENMVSPGGKKVLDIGTGTGAVALLCAIGGATLVHATDINPNAIVNARENFRKRQFDEKRCMAYYSNLFSNVSQKFDIIHFNPPWCGYKAQDVLDESLTDEGYSITRRFMAEAGGYLEEGGTLCIQWSDMSDMALMAELIEQNEYAIEQFSEEKQDCCAFMFVLKKKN